MDKTSEAALARALMAGESHAFEQFVAYFRSKVFHYSWLMCGKPEDAEEVAQETLLRVFENLEQLREPEHVRAWVFRIAKNVCLMQRRKSIFAPSHEISTDELAPAEEPSGAELPPDRAYLRGELKAVLERIIAELPPIYRAVVVLREMEELSTEETAQILDLTADVVKTRLHRARQAMRLKLDCYLHNRCVEDQPAPSPAPLSLEERERLLEAWRKQPAA